MSDQINYEHERFLKALRQVRIKYPEANYSDAWNLYASYGPCNDHQGEPGVVTFAANCERAEEVLCTVTAKTIANATDKDDGDALKGIGLAAPDLKEVTDRAIETICKNRVARELLSNCLWELNREAY